MMGIKQRVFDPLPRQVSLEELVPKDNFYRHLEATLDLSFVRELVRPLYAKGGRPSVDPVVFFRLQLVMFFEDIRSERQLMKVAADRLSVRWFLGYDLYESLPDHSSLTRIRERYGLEVFRRFFEQIVEECFEAGLVWGKELFFDSTKVEADAAMDSLVPRWAVEAHLGGLFEEAPPEDDRSITEEIGALPSAGDADLCKRNAAKKDWISRDGAQDRSFRGTPWRERTSDTRASKTDPDATPMSWACSGRKLGYQAHYVVDGGKARVVLNALVAPAEVTENRPMLDLLWRTCFRWRLRTHNVTADGKYGTLENIAALEEAGVRAYVALHESGSKPGSFPKGDFRYDLERDVYSCPAGKLLRPLGKRNAADSDGKVTFYRAKASECAVCQLRSRCTSNKNGRQLRRDPKEHYAERVRAYRGTYLYEKALRKRRVWVEPLFAEAKDWHGMRRFRLRRLEKVNIEALLITSGQNVKRLLDFGGRRPKKLAQAAALLPPVATGHESSRAREHRWSCSWRPTRAFFNSLERFLDDAAGWSSVKWALRIRSVVLPSFGACRSRSLLGPEHWAYKEGALHAALFCSRRLPALDVRRRGTHEICANKLSMWYIDAMETLGTTGERPAEDRVGRVLSGLGSKVRRARRERGMTLEGLAAAAGTSAAHLSRLESGERQPSLDGALRLAVGLGVPFSELFEEPEEPGPGTVVRGGEAPVYEGTGFRVQPLVPQAGPEGISAVKVVYPADRVVDPELHEHEGQEWLYMLKGRLRLTLGTERTVLEPGDAAFFDARLPHNFDVLSEEDAEVLMVSCVPCAHRRVSPEARHPFTEGHRGFGEAAAGGPRAEEER